MEIIAGLLFGFLVGYKWDRGWYKLKKEIHKHRNGICLNYKGKGLLETIDGTRSEFCVNCGHPHGYHL